MQRYMANPNQQTLFDQHTAPKGTPHEVARNSNISVIQPQRNPPSSVDSNVASLPNNQGTHNSKNNQHGFNAQMSSAQKLSILNEQSWLKIGSIAEMMNDYKKAMHAYEMSIKHNPYSLTSLQRIALIYRQQENFEKAVEYYQRIISIDGTEGETWGAIGHCYLMMNELQKAFNAYQQAIYHFADRKEPKLWYGIGILYECYNSFESAEEAFNAVMQMDPNFEKANEIYFRLGIIYKCQKRYKESLNCFKSIIKSPPKPLTENDLWFQIGNVHELQEEFSSAVRAYERVLHEDPNHSKVLLQLGILFLRADTDLYNPETSLLYLNKAVEMDKSDAQAWYTLGRCGMLLKQYNNAYEAYQQAVYCDATNATYWCSIGVLYYQINQYRDALDAYSRSIRLDPLSSEVWFNLGTLYETCNNQINDAIDAYHRASELDSKNTYIIDRLNILQQVKENRKPPGSTAPPLPIDPPISDLNNTLPNSQQDNDNQNRLPGNLGHPPVSSQGPPLYSMINDKYRNNEEEVNDKLYDKHKDNTKPPARINENSYPNYLSHRGSLDQEAGSNPSAITAGRHSPRMNNLNSEVGRNNIDTPDRSNIGRVSPTTAKPYSYGPNSVGQFSAQQHPLNRNQPNRIAEPVTKNTKNSSNYTNRHSQNSISYQPKQNISYSPVNAYEQRSNNMKKQSPILHNSENLPYGPESEAAASSGLYYKNTLNQSYSNTYYNEQYPPSNDGYLNQTDKNEMRSPIFDRYSTNGATSAENSRNNNRNGFAPMQGVDTPHSSNYSRDDGRQGVYQTNRSQTKPEKGYPFDQPSRYGNRNGNEDPNISPQRIDQNAKLDTRQGYRINNAQQNLYYNGRSQPSQQPDSFNSPHEKINSERRNTYNNSAKPYSQEKTFSPPLVGNNKRFHVSQSPKNNKLSDINTERPVSALDTGFIGDTNQDYNRKHPRQWSSGYSRDSNNQKILQESHEYPLSQQDSATQEDQKSYSKQHNPNSNSLNRSRNYYSMNKSPSLKSQSNIPNSRTTNSFKSLYHENDETSNSKISNGSNFTNSQYPHQHIQNRNIDHKDGSRIQSPDSNYQETHVTKNSQDSEIKGNMDDSTITEQRSKSPLSTKSGPINSNTPTTVPLEKSQTYFLHNSIQSSSRQNQHADSTVLSNNSAPNSTQLPQIKHSASSGYNNLSNSKYSPRTFNNSPLAHSAKEKSLSKYSEPENISPNSSNHNVNQDRHFINYQTKDNNSFHSESESSMVPVKRKSDSPKSHANFSQADVNNNSASDSGSSKSDSNKPLYKRICSTNTPNQNNLEQDISVENSSHQNLTAETSVFSENKESQKKLEENQETISDEIKAENNNGLGINTLTRPKSQNNSEEPEDGEVFDDEEGSRTANKDASHSIKYGVNLENFRVLRTENANSNETNSFNVPGVIPSAAAEVHLHSVKRTRVEYSTVAAPLLPASISMRLVGKLLGEELKLSSTEIRKDPSVLCVKTTLATAKFLNAIALPRYLMLNSIRLAPIPPNQCPP
ncbi:hypothetical protein BB561_001568, partial [Smittium simulii]